MEIFGIICLFYIIVTALLFMFEKPIVRKEKTEQESIDEINLELLLYEVDYVSKHGKLPGP